MLTGCCVIKAQGSATCIFSLWANPSISSVLKILPVFDPSFHSATPVGPCSLEMTDPRAISLQYDFGVSVTALSGKLLQLIGAASEDNVQPQAVLALRALGSFIHPSPHLIGKAVDALDGTKNVNLEHLKLTVGIDSGGTALFLRQSTPGIAAFLLVCALRIAYNDNEIGEIMYGMAAQSGILKSWPTSAQQLSQVVETLSGYAYKLIPTDHMNFITSAMLQNNEGVNIEQMSLEMSAGTLTNTLVTTFMCLRDEDIDKIIWEGAASFTWVATILTWLIPEQTCVVQGQNIVHGDPEAKLVVKLKEMTEGNRVTNDPWTLVKWQKDKPIEHLIEITKGFHEKGYRPFYSRRNCKHKLQSVCNLNSFQTKIFGQIAGAIHCIFIERGRLSLRMENEERRSIPILEMATGWFCREYGCIMQQYGWSADELAEQDKIYEKLHRWPIEPSEVPHRLTKRLIEWMKQN